MALSLLSQERSPDKKAIAEIIGYNERRLQKWELRVVDATGAKELPQYRKILVQGIVRDQGVAQKIDYVSPDGSSPKRTCLGWPETLQSQCRTDAHKRRSRVRSACSASFTRLVFRLRRPFLRGWCEDVARETYERLPNQVRVLFKNYPMDMHP